MSEFFLWIGETNTSHEKMVKDGLKHFADSRIYTYRENRLLFILSSIDDAKLWGPFEQNGVAVFLVGRIAINPNEWSIAEQYPGEGGLACKWIHRQCTQKGLKGLEELNGAYTVFVFDQHAGTIHLVTDRCGMFQCFHCEVSESDWVFSSNADVLARACSVTGSLDLTSLAEFLMAGRVTFPFSYYQKIRSLEPGSVFTFRFHNDGSLCSAARKYFDFCFQLDPYPNERLLAEELAESIKTAVSKRSMPLFGKCAISLSGGLDSRTLLCATQDRVNTVAFSFFDKENYEYRVARRIARGVGVEFHPLKRDFEHYGISAEVGIRLNCAMGDCFNNHLLGFRDVLRQKGIRNIVAGFYFDYLFKGLALDRTLVPYMRTKYPIEKEGSFHQEHYKPHFRFETRASDLALERQEDNFPPLLRIDLTPEKRLTIGAKRVLPFCYEPDQAETVISQKAFPWYLPIVDNDILRMYLKIPPAFRFNAAVYTKAVRLIVGEKIARIPDTNTRARIGATDFEKMVSFHWWVAMDKAKSYLGFRKPAMVNDGSWPNFDYYIANSRVIREIWERPNRMAEDVFTEIVGRAQLKKKISDYSGRELFLFFRLFTLKVWFDQLTV